MLPAARRGDAPRGPLTPSAVLVLLTENGGELQTLLIERAPGEGPHGGQIAFPGGKWEASDASLTATALREAWEETDLDPRQVEPLGLLSPVDIAVSRYRLQPVVGYAAPMPALRPNPTEVSSLFLLSLAEIFRLENRRSGEIMVRGSPMQVPYFAAGEKVIWGATAMVLSEFEEVLRRASAWG
jgi:8-oxo-dGTP pyrophosphatase MutT (NUDIX family)